ncbi:MAG: ABC transporter permease [Acidobacteriota bacterium]
MSLSNRSSKRHKQPHLWLINVIGVIVPRRLRADWKQEWEAELRHREELLADWNKLNWKTKLDLLRRSLGAFWDALLLQPQRLEDEMFQDLRYGIRMLLKDPGFTLIAVVTLALGIGANTTIFTMVNSMLLKPLPFKNPERLVMVWRANAEQTAKDLPSSVPLFIDWQQRNQVFEQMTAFTNGRFNLAGADEAALVRGANVSAGFFETLGVPPLLGRGFLPDEDKPGAEAVVVLSHALWQQQFGAAPGIIGQQVTINARPCTVIGVMPPGFNYPDETRLWRTLTLDPQANRQAYFINVLARLKPGLSREQAHAGMDSMAAELAAQSARSTRDHFDLRPLNEQLTGAIRRPLLVLFGAVAFVLLIACANIANLLLARASGREREMAVRAALGASRGRLLRQLLTESLLLAAFGGIAGLLLAVWSLSWLKGLSVLKLARLDEVALDGRALGFTALAVLLTGAVFGLMPALQVSLQQPSAVLKGSAASRPDGQRLRAGLMVVEIALSLVLLVGAGLLIKSFLKLQAVDPGFKPEGVVTLNLNLPDARYGQPEKRTAFLQQITEKLQALPGVEATATAAYSPLSDIYNSRIFIIEGRPETPQGLFAGQIPVSPDYFRTLQIPLLGGRAFSIHDDAQAPGVVIVNQSFAKRFFPNEEVAGKRIHLGTRRPPVWFEIVGVAGDVRQLKLESEAPPLAYVPHPQSVWSFMSLLVRPKGEPQMVAGALKQAVAAVDKDLGVAGLTTLDATLADSIAERRVLMTLLGVFAGLALLLAAIGIYGVIAYSVAQRTHELGIRMALGAEARDVLRLVQGQGMKLTLLGVAFGLVASFALTRLMETLLFDVSATDPWTFVLLPVLLLVVASVACYFPARRATQVDPLLALRHE